MHVQQKVGVPRTIPKDPIDDYKTYTVRKNIHVIIPFFAYSHSKETNTYLLSL